MPRPCSASEAKDLVRALAAQFLRDAVAERLRSAASPSSSLRTTRLPSAEATRARSRSRLSCTHSAKAASGNVQLPPSARLTARSARTQAAVAGIGERREQRDDLGAVGEAFDAERALPRRRQHLVGVEARA